MLSSRQNHRRRKPEGQRRKKSRAAKPKSLLLTELSTIPAIFRDSDPSASHFAEIISRKTPAQRAGVCQCLNLLHLLMRNSVNLCCNNIHDPTTAHPVKPGFYSMFLPDLQRHLILQHRRIMLTFMDRGRKDIQICSKFRGKFMDIVFIQYGACPVEFFGIRNNIQYIVFRHYFRKHIRFFLRHS